MELTLAELQTHEKVVKALFDRLCLHYCGVCGDYYMGTLYLYEGGQGGKPVALAVTAELLPTSVSLSGVLDSVGIKVISPGGVLGERRFAFDELFGLYTHTADKPEAFYISRRGGWNHTPDPAQMNRGVDILTAYIGLFRSCFGG